MSERIKYVISELNTGLFKYNFNLITFDSVSPEELLQILSNVLAEIHSSDRIDIKNEEPEETTIRLLNMIRVLKYDPGPDAVGFRQGIVQGEKNIIHPLLEWLLKNGEDLKTRAYLSKFLVKLEVPIEILSDTEIAELYEQYEQAIEKFKATHKELTNIRQQSISAAELRSDVEAMEKEKEIVVKKIERLSRKLDEVDNKEALLEAAKQLRQEKERQKDLLQQRQTEMELMQNLQQNFTMLNQKLSDQMQASQGISSEDVISQLEEELKMSTYIVNEKLTKELENKKKEAEILVKIANGPEPTHQNMNDLNRKIAELSEEVSELAQRGLNSKETTDDKLALFRQQAIIIARKKEELAEKFTKAKAELEVLLSKRNNQKGKDSALDETQQKDYIANLKVKSTLYKTRKAQLAALVSESGVLARTIDVLKQMEETLLTGQNDEYEISLENIPKEEIQEQMNNLNQKIAAIKEQITPRREELTKEKEREYELREIYKDKKRIHDSKAATLRAEVTKLEQEVKEIAKEEQADQSEIAILSARADILSALLKKAEEEEVTAAMEKSSIKSKLTQKINEEEKLNQVLKKEQQAAKEVQEKRSKQRDLWYNLETLFECKEKCLKEQKKKDGIMKRTEGTETLVLN